MTAQIELSSCGELATAVTGNSAVTGTLALQSPRTLQSLHAWMGTLHSPEHCSHCMGHCSHCMGHCTHQGTAVGQSLGTLQSETLIVANLAWVLQWFYSALEFPDVKGHYKTWTVDYGLDFGLDRGLGFSL